MGSSKFDISLRLKHPELELGIFCNTLGLEPTRKWKAGEQRTTPSGTLLEGIYDFSYCSCRLSPSDDQELLDTLKGYNEIFKPHKELFHQIRATGGRIEYFIGWYINGNAGEIFDLDLFVSLIDLGIEIALDVYPSIEKILKAR